MKFKITIPAQSLKIEIPEQEIEMDFQPIWEMEPPVIEPPVKPDPPIVVEPDRPKDYIYLRDFEGDLNQQFDQALKQEGKILRLRDNKPYLITDYKQQEPKLKAIVGRSTRLIFDTDVQELFLFENDNPEFGSIGVSWLQNKRFEQATSQPTKALFRTVRDKVKKGKLAMIGSHVPNENTLGINLSRFVYSGSDSNSDFIYVIGKDITGNAGDFMQFKSPNGGNLYSVLDNVHVNNPPNTYHKTHRFVVGIYDGKTFEITSNNTVDQVLTWHGYQNTNIRTILNIGRYVWNIGNDSVSENSKEIYLNNPIPESLITYSKRSNTAFESDAEFQPGDKTTFGVIVSKQISHGFYNWIYSVDEIIENQYLLLIESSIDLPENKEAVIIYKGNSLIERPLTVDSWFAEWQILQSVPFGYPFYNQHENTVYWVNSTLEGFGRLSRSNVGSSKGWYLYNVSGITGQEFTYQNSTEFKEMPKEAKEYIEWLEGLE